MISDRLSVTRLGSFLILVGLLVCGTAVTLNPAKAVALVEDEFRPTTIFLVRHAEKADAPQQDPPLTEKGTARAQELARLLGPANIKLILTSQFQRTKLTAEPLAKQLAITATAQTLKSDPSNPRRISDQSTAETVAMVLQQAGNNVLVVGHSNSIPDVIKALGGDKVPTIDEKKFDDLFVVTVYSKGKASVVHMKYGAAE